MTRSFDALPGMLLLLLLPLMPLLLLRRVRWGACTNTHIHGAGQRSCPSKHSQETSNATFRK
jgi:hypothetical protein